MSATRTARSASAATNADATTASRSAQRSDLLPSEQTQGSIHFLTGGVGLREVIAIRHAMNQFPLTLEFRAKANRRHEFLAGIAVTIRVSTGQVVLKTLSAGPFLLARLRPGTYEIMAERHGKRQTREVEVHANGGERLVFEWNMR